jgi:uncharacterized protein
MTGLRPRSAFVVDGPKIRQIRDRAGLTQTQFAKDVDTTPANLCRIEAGAQQPSLQLRERILARLGIALDDVVTPRSPRLTPGAPMTTDASGPPPNVLLSGVVGSTAYGLAGPDSDIDWLGLFAAPTIAFHGLKQPTESIVSNKPDATFHEARKYCQLALGGNPTVSELMWLPADLYETMTPLGEELISIRPAFLSAKRVRDAYLGYATQQFKRLEARGDGSFSADTRRRTAKHARHLYRLCAQGFELYATGRVRICLDNPHSFHAFGEQVASGDIDAARRMISHHEDLFDATRSVLPDQPDGRTVEDWLLRVRREFL